MTDNEDFTETISEAEKQLEEFKKQHKSLKKKMEEIEEAKSQVESEVNVKASNIDFDRLSEFVKNQYWLINQVDENEYEIFIPSFMDVQAGVLERQVGGFNVFRLDQTTKMISGIPDFLQNQVDLDTEQSFKVKGDLLEYLEEREEEVKEELGDHVTDVSEGKATIKPDHGHELIKDLLDRGEMPFTPTPVEPEDLRKSKTEHELRNYQQDAYEEFEEYGAITVCFMTGAGKTHVGIEALDRLKYDKETGRKAVIVWSTITADQWKERIEKYAPRLNPVIMAGKEFEEVEDIEDCVEIYTYNDLDKLQAVVNNGYEYINMQMDECDFAAAPYFSRLATFPMKYRMGHTASPVRTRERPNDVFALCGKPVGLDWQKTLKYMDMSMFPVNIHTVKDKDKKIDRLEEILDSDKSTMILIESIDYGEKIAERLDLEFVHGNTSGKKKKKIEDAIVEDGACVVSRIGRRGVSLDVIERLIEVDRRGDSRRDIIQAVGRLFHGHGEQADIIYTVGEANKFEETFLALLGNNFELNDVDDALELQKLGQLAEGVVDIDIEDTKDAELPEIANPIQQEKEASSTPVVNKAGFDNPVEMLKDDKIQEIIEDLLENDSVSFSDEKKKKALIMIAKENGDITHNDISDQLDVSRGDRLTAVWRNNTPQIVEKNSDSKLKVRVEEAEEIKAKYKEQKQREEELKQVEEEIGL